MRKIVSLLLIAAIAILYLLPISSLAETLEITELTYQATYTYVMGKLHQNCRYKELSRVCENDRETVSVMLTDYTSVILIINNSEIESIVHIGSGNGEEDSGLTISCSMIATIMAVDPSATASIALDILNRLQESSETYKTKYCSYQFAFDKDIGSVLTIESV